MNYWKLASWNFQSNIISRDYLICMYFCSCVFLYFLCIYVVFIFFFFFFFFGCFVCLCFEKVIKLYFTTLVLIGDGLFCHGLFVFCFNLKAYSLWKEDIVSLTSAGFTLSELNKPLSAVTWTLINFTTVSQDFRFEI